MPPRPYRNYTDQQIIDAVKNSISIAEVCRKINIVAKGGNFRTVWRNIHRLGLDTLTCCTKDTAKVNVSSQ